MVRYESLAKYGFWSGMGVARYGGVAMEGCVVPSVPQVKWRIQYQFHSTALQDWGV